ncbi:PQQ-binding-like beta-propeller repeat protein [Candidatus Bathyarchaeota archaeon A05DMB-2]|jgi:outer membrane protein assembly factor BamB|nr:PQQ-binding-like beta-propeller repeat protein [Candidatus Bathyarchaeota archaeon A05DMB-2]
MVPVGTVMLASDSEKLILVVQEEPVKYYPSMPLPTEYWTRPIDPQLREWSVIAGNWLYWSPRNLYAPYNEGPETAHVLWAKPLTTGGLVGGSLGEPALEALGYHGFEEGDAYEGKFGGRFGGPVILGGKFYYEKYASPDKYKETVCVDLRTGEELWSRVMLNNLTISFAQLLYWDTYDYHGVYDYLWAVGDAGTRTLLGLPSTAGTIWCAFDPFTGDFVYALYGIPSGTRVYGPKGEILYYTFNLAAGYMTLWNSTNIPQLYASTTYPSMGWGQWRPMGKVINATAAIVSPTTPLGLAGYTWNKTIPTGLPGSVQAVLDDRVVGARITQTEVNLWAFSLKQGQEGFLLFNKTWKAPAEWAEGNVSVSFGAISSQGKDGVFTLWAAELTKHYGFSAETGDFLWETDSEHYLNTWVGTVRYIAYGRLISSGISGIVYAYDLKTGKTAWTYHANDPYQEILWANDWWMRPVFITDGKIYLGHLEHSPIDPKPRGAPFICLNVTTGEEIWRVNGLTRLTYWGGGPALIGDSVIATMDTYDQRIYAIGKGPSATSALIRNNVVTEGNYVLIEGTVTDISPGTESYALRARFPNGVPAVSDECMSDWMLYVYKQFPRPSNASGVEVSIDAIDPNNNFIHLGTATSDASGFYSFAWETPPVPGRYTIIVTFGGSKAYYASFAETAAIVTEAPEATPEPTPTPVSMAELYFMPMSIAIIIAIVAVGAVMMLLFRRRP